MEAAPGRKVIINLPATVAMSMPHVYASQIEYMSKNLHDRQNVIVSRTLTTTEERQLPTANLGFWPEVTELKGPFWQRRKNWKCRSGNSGNESVLAWH